MTFRLVASVCLLSFVLSPSIVAKAETPDQAQKVIDSLSPSIVTVKIVTKIQRQGGGGEAHEVQQVVPGAIVRPTGLIMITSLTITSNEGVSLTPTDIKVVIGGEDKEYNAFLAATDSKLGLAFVQIQELGDRKLVAVDFSQAPTPVIGEEVAVVSRLGKPYAYAPYYQYGHVAGAITKPRQSWAISGGIVSIGLPVTGLDNDAPIGVLTIPDMGSSDTDTEQTVDLIGQAVGGVVPADRFGIVLIPGASLVTVIDEAAQQAVTIGTNKAVKPAAGAAAKPAPAAQAPSK